VVDQRHDLAPRRSRWALASQSCRLSFAKTGGLHASSPRSVRRRLSMSLATYHVPPPCRWKVPTAFGPPEDFYGQSLHAAEGVNEREPERRELSAVRCR
jgi:hypothetical protein